MPLHIAFQSRIKSAQFNVIFPDGKGGAITLSKVTLDPWQPSEEIESIVIIWKH